MTETRLTTKAGVLRVVTADAAVVGTGAAGYAAAVRLREAGVDCCILTEGKNCGTSRNTGSDKQTYYKLSLSGQSGDSPADMAADFMAGGAMDGDTALCEAACSAACFLKLADSGVPFPVNRYGEYVGYKTDHDTRGRATSAGPLTSKMMTEALERAADRLGVPVLDGLMAVEILTDKDGVLGLVALDLNAAPDERFLFVRSGSVVFATGGPAGIYADTVYPHGHTGSSGVLFAAGAAGQNLTEWQYGLASVAPRWNVSGTYMQVLPRFFSTDGKERKYFLEEAFGAETADRTFLKGYEWPFDSRKIGGSSAVDLLVYREQAAGRKVYLDFTGNIPGAAPGAEATAYLTAAGAADGTPVERLCMMNEPAYRLYLDKGVDLAREPLEIALCAQHCNGGIAVDLWWQTDIPGLSVIGEAAGTHGVYRPGGSALNAGQVGALRAAQWIAAHPRQPREAAFVPAAEKAAAAHAALVRAAASGTVDVREATGSFRRAMSLGAGPVRDAASVRALRKTASETAALPFKAADNELPALYKLYDALSAASAVLAAMEDFYDHTGGRTRGSALYPTPDGEKEPFTGIVFRRGAPGDIQQTRLTKDGPECTWRAPRPMPEPGGFFENVWREYRANKNVW